MKPVNEFINFRPLNVKEKVSLFSRTLVIFQNGKVLHEILVFKIMYVKNIFLIHCYLEVVNLI